MAYKFLWEICVCLSFVVNLCAIEGELDRLGDLGFEKICDSPLIYGCDYFLSDEECDHLICLGKPFLHRSTVVSSSGSVGSIDSSRTSLGMFISSRLKDEMVKRIIDRIVSVTGIPKENGEDIQILYYDVGGEYKPHYDYFDPNTPGGLFHYNRGGQRVATFMVYLNTPEKGGQTIFPKAKLSVNPAKGRALLFYNVDARGSEDPMSLHGGAPVVSGEKWIMTLWLREGAFR